jgi:hypothetical protein
MDRYWLSRTLEDNPAIRVLRAENGPIILGFLHRAFEENHLITIANQDLVLQLAAFLEEQGYQDGADGDVLDRATTLVENWCGEKSRYVRKYNDDRGVVYRVGSGKESARTGANHTRARCVVPWRHGISRARLSRP